MLLADELRLGLRGQVRRVLAPRGVKVVQRIQIEYRWRYLLLGIEPRTGALNWRWLERFRQDRLKPVLAEWEPAAVVWDGAGAQRGKQLGDLPTVRIFLPPYRPELNPAERVLGHVRARLAHRLFATRADLAQAIAAALRELWDDPARVTRLTAYPWWRAGLDATAPSSS